MPSARKRGPKFKPLRRKRDLSPKVKLWSGDDLQQLLLWLEYSKGTVAGEQKKQNAVDHFREYRGKFYSFKQIDEQVQQLWEDHMHGEAKNYSTHVCLYHIGINGLSNVTTDWRATKTQIRQLIMRLQSGQVPKAIVRNKITGDFLTISTPDKPKSRSQAKHRAIKEANCSNNVSNQLRRLTDTNLQQVSRSSDRSCEVPQTPTAHKNSSSSPDYALPRTPSCSSLTVSEKEVGSPTPSTTSDQTDAESVDYTFSRHMSSESFYHGDYPCDNYGCRKKIKDLRKALATTNERMANSGNSFGSTVKKNSSEEKLEAAAAELAKCHIRIAQLKSVIRDKQRNTSFILELGASHFRLDTRPLEKKMDEMQVAIQQGLALDYAEMDEACAELPPVIDNELCVLLRRVVGRHEENVRRMKFQTLIRSLVSASVCVWVLESRLVDECLQSTPIMEKCLDELRSQDGREAVRNLHFAANTRLIESEHFQTNVIPAKAVTLAKRLVRVLTTLSQMQQPVYQGKADAIVKWEEQEPRLRKIFCAALRVKAQAVISRAVFETDFPQSGIPFDPDRMSTSGSMTLLATVNERAKSVLVSLIPGLRMFAADPDLVDYNSFRQTNLDRNAKFDQVRKPLVLTEVQ